MSCVFVVLFAFCFYFVFLFVYCAWWIDLVSASRQTEGRNAQAVHVFEHPGVLFCLGHEARGPFIVLRPRARETRGAGKSPQLKTYESLAILRKP